MARPKYARTEGIKSKPDRNHGHEKYLPEKPIVDGSSFKALCEKLDRIDRERAG